MNILHTVFSFNNGGIENLLVDIINNWNYEEDKIILCIINNDYNIELLKKIKKNNRVQVILLNREKNSSGIRVILKYINIILKNKIDIIHCHLYEAVKISILGKLIRPNIKIFYTVHDKKIYNKFSKIDILIQNYFIKKILAISNSVKEDIVSINNKIPVEVLRNSIDLEKFNIPKVKHKGIRIGCVARIMPEKKGQDILLRAISIVKEIYPNVECWIAGEPKKGEEKSLLNLKILSERLNIKSNICFKGNVSNIPLFLSEIDIFVLPSRYEGFGIAIIEAMASRVPVIASNLEGPKEIIKDNNFGELFNVEDYKQLANLIIKLIETKPNMKVEESYKYVEKNFNINVMNKRLKTIYSGEKNNEY